MSCYRITYTGPISVTFVGSTPGDATLQMWQRYRENVQAGMVHFEEGAVFLDIGGSTESVVTTTVTMDTVFSKEIHADDPKEAVKYFAEEAVGWRMIPLGFDPGCVSVEIVDGLEIPA